MYSYSHISNDELANVIDQWIKNERNRKILKRRLIDGICYEPLAEELSLSVTQVKTIIYKYEKIVFEHL